MTEVANTRRRYGAGESSEENQPLLIQHNAAPASGVRGLLRSSGYTLYVLLLLLLAYLLNQLDRYMLAIVARPSAQEIGFGSRGCLLNATAGSALTEADCANSSTTAACVVRHDPAGVIGCKWDYTGTGTQYNLLAGPVFILVYTFAGIPVGFAADIYNRKVLLAAACFTWSACTFLTGFAQHYWQLAVLRFGIGFGEAGCTPFATSLIADYFSPELRGAALGIYNWGIYFGYSLSYAVGNFITDANILGMGWRWAYFLSGSPGLLVGPLILLTLAEPPRSTAAAAPAVPAAGYKLPALLRLFCSPSLFLLCLAGAVRNAAGYVWAYNTQPYFEAIGQTPAQIGAYMSWLPLVAGSVGVLFGGFISDRVVSRVGPHGRVWVIVCSQLLAAPFAAGVLFLRPPWAYISLIPTYVIGEMWVPTTLAVLVELVPAEVRTTAVAFYFFVISNVGGNMPLLLEPVRKAFSAAGHNDVESLRGALYLFYPGEYVAGAALYLLALAALRRDLMTARRRPPPQPAAVSGDQEHSDASGRSQVT